MHEHVNKTYKIKGRYKPAQFPFINRDQLSGGIDKINRNNYYLNS